MYFETLRAAFKAFTVACRIVDTAGPLRSGASVDSRRGTTSVVATRLRVSAEEARELAEELDLLADRFDSHEASASAKTPAARAVS
jgi:hypothetical protein